VFLGFHVPPLLPVFNTYNLVLFLQTLLCQLSGDQLTYLSVTHKLVGVVNQTLLGGVFGPMRNYNPNKQSNRY
jgi:hypothetical protein